MIKTIIAGEALERALDRHQQWLDEYDALKQTRIRETERLTTENSWLRRRLRMAKATLRPEAR